MVDGVPTQGSFNVSAECIAVVTGVDGGTIAREIVGDMRLKSAVALYSRGRTCVVCDFRNGDVFYKRVGGEREPVTADVVYKYLVYVKEDASVSSASYPAAVVSPARDPAASSPADGVSSALPEPPSRRGSPATAAVGTGGKRRNKVPAANSTPKKPRGRTKTTTSVGGSLEAEERERAQLEQDAEEEKAHEKEGKALERDQLLDMEAEAEEQRQQEKEAGKGRKERGRATARGCGGGPMPERARERGSTSATHRKIATLASDSDSDATTAHAAAVDTASLRTRSDSVDNTTTGAHGCHRCGEWVPELDIAFCTNPLISGAFGFCLTKFCLGCLRRRGDTRESIGLDIHWKCISCRGLCDCNPCSKRVCPFVNDPNGRENLHTNRHLCGGGADARDGDGDDMVDEA
jgi:hypothetical protein